MPAGKRARSMQEVQNALDTSTKGKEHGPADMEKTTEGKTSQADEMTGIATKALDDVTAEVQEKAESSATFGDAVSGVQEKVVESSAEVGDVAAQAQEMVEESSAAVGDAATQEQETLEESSAEVGDAAVQVQEKVEESSQETVEESSAESGDAVDAVAGNTRLFEMGAPLRTRQSNVGALVAGFVMGTVTAAGLAFFIGRSGSGRADAVASLEAGLVE
jgi:hypothetical protein